MADELKVKDIHAPGVAEEFDRLTIEDLTGLLLKREEFIESDCPACLGKESEYQFEYQGLSYRRCRRCETLYISPAPTEEAHLDYVINSTAMAFWRNNMPEGMKKSRKPMYEDRVSYFLAMEEKYGWRARKSLEIGAGNGEFAEALSASVDLEKIVLLEPQELELKDKNIEIIKGGFEEVKDRNELFDVIFFWEVIEHILEPDNFLGLVRQCLVPGKPIILSTPNERSVETRELERDSTNILFDHVRLYNPESVTILLERNGFRVTDISTPGKLDVERLLTKHIEKSHYFDNNPSLRFILSNGPDVRNDFQTFLQNNLCSSHMRVTAVAV